MEGDACLGSVFQEKNAFTVPNTDKANSIAIYLGVKITFSL